MGLLILSTFLEACVIVLFMLTLQGPEKIGNWLCLTISILLTWYMWKLTIRVVKKEFPRQQESGNKHPDR